MKSKEKLSRRRKFVYTLIALIICLPLLNFLAWLFGPSEELWENALMRNYPQNSFGPNHQLRSVPDENRWYRIEPEPVIPTMGKLILHFGDSSTWGWGLENRNDAYPTALNKHLPQGTHSVNLGVPGYSSLQGLQHMEEVIPTYRDRIAAATLYFGNNDSTNNGSSDTWKLEARSVWLRKIALTRIVYDWKTKSSEVPRVNPEDFEKNMRRMITIAREQNICVILIQPPVRLVWQPAHRSHLVALQPHNSWTEKELEKAWNLYQQGMKILETSRRFTESPESPLKQAVEHDWIIPRIKGSWRQVIRKLGDSSGIQLVDLQSLYTLAGEEFFVDYCHPSAALHEQITKRIAATLKAATHE